MKKLAIAAVIATLGTTAALPAGAENGFLACIIRVVQRASGARAPLGQRRALVRPVHWKKSGGKMKATLYWAARWATTCKATQALRSGTRKWS